jgi:GNAT superfamily N-acetyltransferase
MITFKKADFDCLELYNQIPMKVLVTRIIEVKKSGTGLGVIAYEFHEKDVRPYIKDFAEEGESAVRWKKEFDISHWALFMAFDTLKPIGGAVVAARTPSIRMLDGRDDIALLWDIRVDDHYKRQGIGHRLFTMAVDWSKEQGYQYLKIECQNTNLPACRFYEKHGAELIVVNEHAYGNGEVMFLWYLSL